MRRWFRQLSDRGARVLLVYSDDDSGFDELKAHMDQATTTSVQHVSKNDVVVAPRPSSAAADVTPLVSEPKHALATEAAPMTVAMAATSETRVSAAITHVPVLEPVVDRPVSEALSSLKIVRGEKRVEAVSIVAVEAAVTPIPDESHTNSSTARSFNHFRFNAWTKITLISAARRSPNAAS